MSWAHSGAALQRCPRASASPHQRLSRTRTLVVRPRTSKLFAAAGAAGLFPGWTLVGLWCTNSMFFVDQIGRKVRTPRARLMAINLHTHSLSLLSLRRGILDPPTVRSPCLGETPSPRVRCRLAMFTYLLTNPRFEVHVEASHLARKARDAAFLLLHRPKFSSILPPPT
jgi:hypothetical protein